MCTCAPTAPTLTTTPNAPRIGNPPRATSIRPRGSIGKLLMQLLQLGLGSDRKCLSRVLQVPQVLHKAILQIRSLLLCNQPIRHDQVEVRVPRPELQWNRSSIHTHRNEHVAHGDLRGRCRLDSLLLLQGLSNFSLSLCNRRAKILTLPGQLPVLALDRIDLLYNLRISRKEILVLRLYSIELILQFVSSPPHLIPGSNNLIQLGLHLAQFLLVCAPLRPTSLDGNLEFLS
mmetsp:Transcript_85483/g.217944  ORF Transcript_85483/g.217944 Transcript_85483/m.217944 type:complete len:231 (-) Transcript_85483:1924-2616(-)